MSFLNLLDLPTSEVKENPTIHLVIGNKQIGITPIWTNLIFLTYYATNDYRYASNLYISAFTLQLFVNFIMLDADYERKWKLQKKRKKLKVKLHVLEQQPKK